MLTSPYRSALAPRWHMLYGRAQEQTTLPSTTVIWIGLAFVGSAASILGVLVMNRVVRTQRRARQARASGEHTTFADLWRADGGLWGFFTGLGVDRLGGGVGMLPDFAGMRNMEEMLRLRMWQLDTSGASVQLKTPEMWEVQVGQHPGVFQPISVTCQAASKDDNGRPLAPPVLDMSLLIALPSPVAPTSDYDGDSELLIGTTTLLPWVLGGQHGHHGQGEREASIEPELFGPCTCSEADLDGSVKIEAVLYQDGNTEAKGGAKQEVAHLEHAPDQGDRPRRAGWVQRRNGWKIEGIT